MTMVGHFLFSIEEDRHIVQNDSNVSAIQKQNYKRSAKASKETIIKIFVFFLL